MHSYTDDFQPDDFPYSAVGDDCIERPHSGRNSAEDQEAEARALKTCEGGLLGGRESIPCIVTKRWSGRVWLAWFTAYTQFACMGKMFLYNGLKTKKGGMILDFPKNSNRYYSKS